MAVPRTPRPAKHLRVGFTPGVFTDPHAREGERECVALVSSSNSESRFTITILPKMPFQHGSRNRELPVLHAPEQSTAKTELKVHSLHHRRGPRSIERVVAGGFLGGTPPALFL